MAVVQCGRVSSAQLLTIARVLIALDRLPRVCNLGNIDVEVAGPRLTYGDVETHLWWHFYLEEGG